MRDEGGRANDQAAVGGGRLGGRDGAPAGYVGEETAGLRARIAVAEALRDEHRARIDEPKEALSASSRRAGEAERRRAEQDQRLGELLHRLGELQEELRRRPARRPGLEA